MSTETDLPTGSPTQELDTPDMDPQPGRSSCAAAFRWLNQIHGLDVAAGTRASGSTMPAPSGQIMVITHIGRKSGLRRQTPVNYALVDGELVLHVRIRPDLADWYRNVRVAAQGGGVAAARPMDG